MCFVLLSSASCVAHGDTLGSWRRRNFLSHTVGESALEYHDLALNKITDIHMVEEPSIVNRHGRSPKADDEVDEEGFQTVGKKKKAQVGMEVVTSNMLSLGIGDNIYKGEQRQKQFL